MAENIKMAAVDIDGTFVRSDYTYDVPRFKRILSHMKKEGCNFVVASGNQYYQLRDLFPGYYDELSFVAENGAFVKDHKEMVFTADMPKETVDLVIDVQVALQQRIVVRRTTAILFGQMEQLLAVALKFGFKSVDTAVELLYSGIHSLLLFNRLLQCKHNIIF